MKNYDVLIITDFEEGHLFPLFNLADSLKKNGIDACFVGLADTMAIAEEMGYDQYTILTSIFPKGYVGRLKKNRIKTDSISMDYLVPFFEDFEILMKCLNPKLVFLSHFFGLESLLLHYKYGIKQVIFHTLLPSLESDPSITLGQHSAGMCTDKFLKLSVDLSLFFMDFFTEENLIFESFEEMTSPLENMYQVVLSPKELDIGRQYVNEKEIFLGPCINKTRLGNKNNFSDSLEIMSSDRIIFASMGSQTKEYPIKALHFFNSILKAMKLVPLKSFHLVLSVGSNLEDWKLEDIPENASVFSWVPQLTVLQSASVAIIHGGLGSVKECIYFGVPMLVIPMGRDQEDNANRSEHLGIGFNLDIEKVNSEVLTEKIVRLSNDNEINKQVVKMKNLFQQADEEEKVVNLVKTLLAKEHPNRHNLHTS